MNTGYTGYVGQEQRHRVNRLLALMDVATDTGHCYSMQNLEALARCGTLDELRAKMLELKIPPADAIMMLWNTMTMM